MVVAAASMLAAMMRAGRGMKPDEAFLAYRRCCISASCLHLDGDRAFASQSDLENYVKLQDIVRRRSLRS